MASFFAFLEVPPSIVPFQSRSYATALIVRSQLEHPGYFALSIGIYQYKYQWKTKYYGRVKVLHRRSGKIRFLLEARTYWSTRTSTVVLEVQFIPSRGALPYDSL